MFHLPERWLLDALDILLVSFLFYRLFLRVKGTRAAQMFASLIFILGVSLLARWLQLNALNWIFNTLRTVWVVAFVVIFQPELRGALAQLGQAPLLSRLFRTGRREVILEVCEAAAQLRERRWGGLMVLERDIGLMNYSETGTRIQSGVHREMLVTIFTPGSPLHDGAVIISGNTLVSAGCILPLSQNLDPAVRVGMRHRAALGISEETDAVVVVVSEERREIALAVAGQLRRGLDDGQLKLALQDLMGSRQFHWRRFWRGLNKKTAESAAQG